LEDPAAVGHDGEGAQLEELMGGGMMMTARSKMPVSP